MSNISDWFLANELTLNISKSSCVLFTKNKNKVTLSIKIHDNPIPQHSQVKFLIVWLDEKLECSQHCNMVLNKIKRNTYLLRLGQNCLTHHALKLIYYAHIQIHVQYGLFVWGNQCAAKFGKSIQTQINKCITLVKKRETAQIKTPTLVKFLNFNQLVKLENFKLGFKIRNNKLPCRISCMVSHDKNKKCLNKKHN